MSQIDISGYWKNAHTYHEFRSLMSSLHSENKVTGPNQSEDLLNYSLLNEQRMNRIDKHGSIPALVRSTKNIKVLVITEGWCGDSAQILPYMHKWVEGKGFDMRIVLRDENLDLMDMFLTNGARAVPMFIFLSEDGSLVCQWGARPKELQEKVNGWKAQGLKKEEFITLIHKWYADDKGQCCIQEWEALPVAQ